MCIDNQTAIKGKISYPRLLVEVKTKGELIEQIKFKGPENEMIVQEVVYEWIPRQCCRCEKWGHRTEDCRTKMKHVRR